MTETCGVDGCQMDESGVCALHGVEVERRKNQEELTRQIPNLVVATKTLLATSGLILLMIGGSFTYTKMVKDDLLASVFKIYDSCEDIDDKFHKIKSNFDSHKGEFVQKYNGLQRRVARLEE